MPTPLLIVIPSHDRDGLLERTLTSLAECSLPPTLKKVIVAENGAKLGAEQVVAKFTGRLPIQYQFSAAANKSRALNQALAESTDEFVIFYDDDVRIDPNNPMAYARAIEAHGKDRFFSGRCGADWDEPPPAWLLRYLPPSAKGWSRGETACELEKPEGLGFNWGAFASDIRSVGWFNENRGPGTVSRGQETDMMERLVAAGKRGVYVPDAVVWHYVPTRRCSQEWALDRAEQTAVYCGTNLAKLSSIRRLRRRVMSWARMLGSTLYLRTFAEKLPVEKRFHYEYRRRWHQGILKGERMARLNGKAETLKS